MEIVEYLRKHLINRLPKLNLQEIKPLSEEDVALLAYISIMCEAQVSKQSVFTTSYAYYIPGYDSDLDIVKNLFSKSGIRFQEHYTHITGIKQKALRVNYSLCLDKDGVFKQMWKIRQKYKDIYAEGKQKERILLQQRITKLRQNQRH
ncbi:MAG: hypothetical protein IKN73_01565 [Alphaproteobacteria bacterium]|nr:hypothetical protein [Alphaproteobacteria bacterium]